MSWMEERVVVDGWGDSGLHAELEIGPREGLGVECGDRMMFFCV